MHHLLILVFGSRLQVGYIAFTAAAQMLSVFSRGPLAAFEMLPSGERSGGLSDAGALQRFIVRPQTAGKPRCFTGTAFLL